MLTNFLRFPTISQKMSNFLNCLRHATTVVEGQTIYYETIGNGSKTILLMPGGLGSIRTDFQTILHKFDPQTFTVVAWDPPGFGRSRPPDRTWPALYFDRDAEVALAFMSQLKHSQYSCVGWSEGGNTAMMMAAMKPDVIENLVVWGTNSFITQKDKDNLKFASNPDNWSARMRTPFEEDLGRDYFCKQLREWVKAYIDYPDGEIYRKRLKDIQCPTLLINGKKDVIIDHVHYGVLHKEIKGSKRIDYEDGKHNLHMKYADRFVEDVTNFLEGKN